MKSDDAWIFVGQIFDQLPVAMLRAVYTLVLLLPLWPKPCSAMPSDLPPVACDGARIHGGRRLHPGTRDRRHDAVFSVVYGILFRPLPFPNADRLVQIVQLVPARGGGTAVALGAVHATGRRMARRRAARWPRSGITCRRRPAY